MGIGPNQRLCGLASEPPALAGRLAPVAVRAKHLAAAHLPGDGLPGGYPKDHSGDTRLLLAGVVKLQNHGVILAAMRARMPAQVFQYAELVPKRELLPVSAPPRVGAWAAVALEPIRLPAVFLERRHTQGALATRTEFPRASAMGDGRLPEECLGGCGKERLVDSGPDLCC